MDQYGQVIDVYLSDKRDTVAATRFFTAAIGSHGEPVVAVAYGHKKGSSHGVRGGDSS